MPRRSKRGSQGDPPLRVEEVDLGRAPDSGLSLKAGLVTQSWVRLALGATVNDVSAVRAVMQREDP